MSTRTIRLPFRDRSDSFNAAEIVADASGFDRESRATVRRVALTLATEASVSTVADALDHLARISPDERRAIAGWPSRRQEEQRAAYEAANNGPISGRPRDSSGAIEAICSASTCRRFMPHRELPNAKARVRVRRWFCPEHEHLAEPGDDEPPRTALGFSPTGAIVNRDEREVERQKAATEAAIRERRRAARTAQRQQEAAQLAQNDRVRAERQRSEMPRGLR